MSANNLRPGLLAGLGKQRKAVCFWGSAIGRSKQTLPRIHPFWVFTSIKKPVAGD